MSLARPIFSVFRYGEDRKFLPLSVLFWPFAMELIWDGVSFSLTVNCCVVVEIYEIIIVWSYFCNGEIYTRKRLIFLAILLFWKIWFWWSCECTKCNILFNGEIICEFEILCVLRSHWTWYFDSFGHCKFSCLSVVLKL